MCSHAYYWVGISVFHHFTPSMACNSLFGAYDCPAGRWNRTDHQLKNMPNDKPRMLLHACCLYYDEGHCVRHCVLINSHFGGISSNTVALYTTYTILRKKCFYRTFYLFDMHENK